MLFVTVATCNRKPVLASPAAHAALRRAWSIADRWRVGRYVVMPDHVHLFASPTAAARSLVSWIQFWKSLVSREWADRDDLPLWQRDFWDTEIRSREGYASKWVYVEQNPLRRGLVTAPEAWPYRGSLHVLAWD